MRRLFAGLLCTAAAAGAGGAPAAQDLEKLVISRDAASRAKVRDEISLEAARRIADACVEQAVARQLTTSVVILNPSGNMVYAARLDGQQPVQIETALMKARSALYMRESTHAWQNRTQADVTLGVRLLALDQYFNSGGQPIIVNDVLIGAIGVGGMGPSAEWSDEICAHNALTKVLRPQPPLAPFLPPQGPPR